MLDTTLPFPITVTFIVVALAFLCSLRLVLLPRLAVHRRHGTSKDIRCLLSPPGGSIGRLLASRARANQRLVRPFNLTNTFVSQDLHIHRTFVTRARTLLKQSNSRGWREFRDLATQATLFELAASQDGALEYGVFMQCLVLRVILVGLLGVKAPVDGFSRQDILIVATHINQLWTLSKGSNPPPPHLLLFLAESLRRLIPDTDTFPNPVDIVIPAWETLWRVVATTIAYSHNNPSLVDVFRTFYSMPSDKTFRGAGEALNAQNVIDETLRMHPPSKHIGRVVPRRLFGHLPAYILDLVGHRFPQVVYSREYADVAGVLTSESIWGPDAAQFDPSRYGRTGISEEQKEALSFAFGYGPLRCVGSAWAPVAVATICSAVLDALDREGYEIVPGSSIGGRDNWTGWYVKKLEREEVMLK